MIIIALEADKRLVTRCIKWHFGEKISGSSVNFWKTRMR